MQTMVFVSSKVPMIPRERKKANKPNAAMSMMCRIVSLSGDMNHVTTSRMNGRPMPMSTSCALRSNFGILSDNCVRRKNKLLKQLRRDFSQLVALK